MMIGIGFVALVAALAVRGESPAGCKDAPSRVFSPTAPDSVLAVRHGPLGQAATPRDIDNELRAIEERRRAAIAARDAATLDAIYAEDFQGIAGNGAVIDKKTLLGVLARASADVTWATTEIAVTSVGPDTALFAGRLTGTAGGRVVSDARFTHLFARRGGRWVCIAGQTTPFPAAPPPRRGSFFAVSVKDAPAAARWYRERLGFETLREGVSPDGKTGFALLRRQDDLIEIVQRQGAVDPPAAAAEDRSYERGLFKVGFWVGDGLAALEADLRAKGTAFEFGITTPPRADYQTFAVTDPDGNVVQFFGQAAR
jgi:catechol 2,3-dioxygenase-like lactoylglutathione lyase family enzyme/ketosteroid isomerase-like protein